MPSQSFNILGASNFKARPPVGGLGLDPGELYGTGELPRGSTDIDDEALADIADSVAYEPKYSSSIENRILSGMTKDRRFISGLIGSAPANPWAAVVALGGINRERESLDALDKLRSFAQHERLAKMLAFKEKQAAAAEKEKNSNFLTAMSNGPGMKAWSYVSQLPGGVEGFLKGKTVDEAMRDFYNNHRHTQEYVDYASNANLEDEQKRRETERKQLESDIKDISPYLPSYIKYKFGDIDSLSKTNVDPQGRLNLLEKAHYLTNTPEFNDYVARRQREIYAESAEDTRGRIKEEGEEKRTKDAKKEVRSFMDGVHRQLADYIAARKADLIMNDMLDVGYETDLSQDNFEKIRNIADSPDFIKYQKNIEKIDWASTEKKEEARQAVERKDAHRFLNLLSPALEGFIEEKRGGVDKFIENPRWKGTATELMKGREFKIFESEIWPEKLKEEKKITPAQELRLSKAIQEAEAAYNQSLRMGKKDKAKELLGPINRGRATLGLSPIEPPPDEESPEIKKGPGLVEELINNLGSLTNKSRNYLSSLLPPAAEFPKEPPPEDKKKSQNIISRLLGSNDKSILPPGPTEIRPSMGSFEKSPAGAMPPEPVGAAGLTPPEPQRVQSPKTLSIPEQLEQLNKLGLTEPQRAARDGLMWRMKALNNDKSPPPENQVEILNTWRRNGYNISDAEINTIIKLSPPGLEIYKKLQKTEDMQSKNQTISPAAMALYNIIETF